MLVTGSLLKAAGVPPTPCHWLLQGVECGGGAGRVGIWGQTGEASWDMLAAGATDPGFGRTLPLTHCVTRHRSLPSLGLSLPVCKMRVGPKSGVHC